MGEMGNWDAEFIKSPEDVSSFMDKGWAFIAKFFIENMDITKIFFPEAYRGGSISGVRFQSFSRRFLVMSCNALKKVLSW
jgi:hypothetical protein